MLVVLDTCDCSLGPEWTSRSWGNDAERSYGGLFFGFGCAWARTQVTGDTHSRGDW